MAKGDRYQGTIRRPGVVLTMMSASRKLAPIKLVEQGPGKKQRPVPVGPFCAATYVSIRATCPDTCAFKDNGCYAQGGVNRRIMGGLDGEVTGKEPVVHREAVLITRSFGRRQVPQDGARGGRDMRLHVGGDVASEDSVRALEAAHQGWFSRGGGCIWTYTHRWREIPAEAWGGIAVWASCETPADVRAAHQASYRATLVVSEPFETDRVHARDGLKVLPCPYETRGVTCVECRLCLDAPIDPKIVIGFVAHGKDKAKAKRRLEVLNA